MTLRYFPSSLVESLIEAAKTGKKTRKPSIKQIMEPEKPGSPTRQFMTDEASAAANKLETEMVKKISASFVADKPFDKLNALGGEIAKAIKSKKETELAAKTQEKEEVLSNVKKTTELLANALADGLQKKVFDPEIDLDVSSKEDVVSNARSAALRRLESLQTVYSEIIAKQKIVQRSNNQIDNLLRSVSTALTDKLNELQNPKDRTEILETFWKAIIERINPSAVPEDEPEVEEADEEIVEPAKQVDDAALKKIVDQLNRTDWDYEYADDPRAYAKGRDSVDAASNMLQQQTPEVLEALALYFIDEQKAGRSKQYMSRVIDFIKKRMGIDVPEATSKQPTSVEPMKPTTKQVGDYFQELAKAANQAKSDLVQVGFTTQNKIGIRFDKGVGTGVERVFYVSGQNVVQVGLELRNSLKALEEVFRGSEAGEKQAGIAVPSFSIDIEKNPGDNTVSFTLRAKNQRALTQVVKAFFGTPAGSNFGKSLTLTQDEAASFGEGTAVVYAQRREQITSDLTKDAYQKQLNKKIASMAQYIASLPSQITDVDAKIAQLDTEVEKRNKEIEERKAIIANPNTDSVEKKTAEREIANLQKEQDIAQKTRAQYVERVESLRAEAENPLDIEKEARKLGIDLAKSFASIEGTVSSNVKQKLQGYRDSVESIIANKSKEQVEKSKSATTNIKNRLQIIEMMKKSTEVFDAAVKIVSFAPANAVDVSLPPSVDFILETDAEKYNDSAAKSTAVFESNTMSIDDLNPVIDALRNVLLEEDTPIQIPDPKDPKKTILGTSKVVDGGIKANVSYSFSENKTSLTIKFNENSRNKISTALQAAGLNNFKQKFVMKKGDLNITRKISASAEYSTRELTRADYDDLASFVAEAQPKTITDYNKSIDEAESLYQERVDETQIEIDGHEQKIRDLLDQIKTAKENNDEELASGLAEEVELEKEELDSKRTLIKSLNDKIKNISALSQKLNLIPTFAKQKGQLMFVNIPNTKILVNPNQINYVIERLDSPYAPANETTTRFTSNAEVSDVEIAVERFLIGLRKAVIREKEKDETARDVLGGVKITLAYSKPSFIVEISYDKSKENLLGRAIATMPESRDFLKTFAKKSGSLMITKQVATEPISAANVVASGEKLKAQKTPKGTIFTYGDQFTSKENTKRRQVYITPNNNVEVTERDFDRFVESFTEGLETQKTDENLQKIMINARKLDKNNNFLFQIDISAFQSDIPLINRVKQASVEQEKFGFTISEETVAKPTAPVLEPGGLPAKPPVAPKGKKQATPVAPEAPAAVAQPQPQVAAPVTPEVAPEEPTPEVEGEPEFDPYAGYVAAEPTKTTEQDELESEIETLEVEKSGVDDQIKSVVGMKPKTEQDKESKDAALGDLESLRIELDKRIAALRQQLEDIVAKPAAPAPKPAEPAPERVTPSVVEPTGKTFVPSEKETEKLRQLTSVQRDLKPIADLWRKVTSRGGGGAAVANLLQRASVDLGDPGFAQKLYKTAKELI